jgi:hypothetical protein
VLARNKILLLVECAYRRAVKPRHSASDIPQGDVITPRNHEQKATNLLGLLGLALFASVHLPAATLYVSTSGNDSSSCISSRPCRTIARASSLTLPGDTVQIAPGVYQERPYLTRSGSASLPITYRGHTGGGCPTTAISDPYSRGKRPAPTVTTWGFYVRADYINLECLKVVSLPKDLVVNPGDLKSGFYIHTGRHHIKVNDNFVDGTAIPGNPSSGIGFGPLANTLPYNVSAARNYVRGTGYGFLIYCGTSCVFEDNEIEDLSTSLKSVDLDYTRVFGTNVTLRRNYFHGNSTLDCIGCHIDCFQTWNLNQYKNEIAQDITIDSNVCFNAHQGIILRDQTSTKQGTYATHFNWTVTNNVFAYGPTGSSMAWCALFEHGGNIKFRHNLCYGSGQVGYLDGSSGIHEYNMHIGSGVPYNANAIAPSWLAGTVSARQNMIYTAGKNFPTSSYPNDIVNVDPLLTNAAIADFRPSANSRALNSAVTSTVTTDRIKVLRPQSGAPDIGPYERPGPGYGSAALRFGGRVSEDPEDSDDVSDNVKDNPVSRLPEEDLDVETDRTILKWELSEAGQIDAAVRQIENACVISSASIQSKEPASYRLVVERASDPQSSEWEAISGSFGLANAEAYGDTALSSWNVAVPAGSVLRIRLLEGASTVSPSQVFLRCQ